jgi:hypothetical protein
VAAAPTNLAKLARNALRFISDSSLDLPKAYSMVSRQQIAVLFVLKRYHGVSWYSYNSSERRSPHLQMHSLGCPEAGVVLGKVAQVTKGDR